MGIFSSKNKNQYDYEDSEQKNQREQPNNNNNNNNNNSSSNKTSNQPKAKAAPKVEKPVVKAPAQPQNPPAETYGIEDAIILMRDLPADKQELVVSVVAKTLESAEISIDKIIADANTKISGINSRTATLVAEIKEFENGISKRKQEISDLEQNLSETKTVKDNFQALSNKQEQQSKSKKSNAKPLASVNVEPQKNVASNGDPDTSTIAEASDDHQDTEEKQLSFP